VALTGSGTDPGDTLGAMPAYPPPAPVHKVPLTPIVDAEIQRGFRAAIAGRAVIAPALTVVALAVGWFDDTPWRRAALLCLVVFAVAASALVERRARRVGVSSDAVGATAIGTNVVAMAVVQIGAITITGGVDSPLLPIVVPLAVLTAVSLGRRPATWLVLGTQAALLTGLTVVQAAGLAPALDMPSLLGPAPTATVRVVRVTVVLGVLGMASTLGVLLRDRFSAMLDTSLHARDDQLETWKSWSHDLEALTGEIAHELKNPLASVKGLAALVDRDLTGARTAERMCVLREEIDRIDTIVEEFLTFSRPITPLARADVGLGDLLHQVARLHEGLAHRAGVDLRVHADDTTVPADPRKLLRVLVNLVQNALSVAPAGSVITMTCTPEAHRVIVDVTDAGPGVPQALRDRVFEAGVTGREDGSGLGLPIALGIVRQHGGDLQLLDAPGGGTVARVTLPRHPPEPQ